MKQVTKQQIANFRDSNIPNPKVDYSMNTCYFKVVDGGETIAASVEPLRAIKRMTSTSELWRVEL